MENLEIRAITEIPTKIDNQEYGKWNNCISYAYPVFLLATLGGAMIYKHVKYRGGEKTKQGSILFSKVKIGT